jgi:hypothetical protein
MHITIAQAAILTDAQVLQAYLSNHSHEPLDTISGYLLAMGYSKSEISDALKEYINGVETQDGN